MKSKCGSMKELNCDLQEFFVKCGVTDEDVAVVKKNGEEYIVIEETVGQNIMHIITEKMTAQGHMTYAVAESPNEHEAKAALLKAKELMAEHKLSEMDVKDVGKKEVKEILLEGMQASTRYNPWIIPLSTVIGENYCCKAFNNKYSGKQLRTIGFVGFEEDVQICEQVFRYAVNCVESKLKEIKKENSCYSAQYRKKLCDGYGYGFMIGVQEAFEKQKEENEEKGWGLVMVMPQEVVEHVKDFRTENFNKNAGSKLDVDAFGIGYTDGKKFDPTKRLEE